VDRDQLKRQRHAEFLAAIVKHHKDFKEYHAARSKKIRKLAKDVANYHLNNQKRQQQEEEKKRKMRLEALKNQNEEEYLKYLDEAKNERYKFASILFYMLIYVSILLD
jgi:hypothetical protein